MATPTAIHTIAILSPGDMGHAVGRVLGHGEEALACNDQLLAGQVAHRAAQCRFRSAVRIDVRGIEEVHAQIVGTLDEPAAARDIECRAERQPTPESDFAHLESAAAYSPVLHLPMLALQSGLPVRQETRDGAGDRAGSDLR